MSCSHGAVSCDACEDQIIVCEVCVALGYDSTEPMRWKRTPQLKGLACTCMLEMWWFSDSETAQRAPMTQLQREQDQKVLIPDHPSPHVLKLVRSALFNYWTFGKRRKINYLVSLKLLNCTRGDANKAISKPITSALLQSCLCNKDQMDINTAFTIFHQELLNALPDDPVVVTLIPEHYRYWHQHPADSLLKFPCAITFSPKHSQENINQVFLRIY